MDQVEEQKRLFQVIFVLLVGFLAMVVVFWDKPSALFLLYAIAGAFGAATALAEIVSRYRDDPLAATLTTAGVCYIALNAAASLGALFLLRDVFGIDLGKEGEVATNAKQVLVAGFGAMTILRSSVISVRAGGADVPVGPAAVVNIFLGALDRDIDRRRAMARTEEVVPMMRGVSFARAKAPLSSLVLSLLQNISAEDVQRIQQRVAALADESGRTEEDKAFELGLLLASEVGVEPLAQAITALSDKIMIGDMDRSEAVRAMMAGLTFAELENTLHTICIALHQNLRAEEQDQLSSDVAELALAEMDDRIKTVVLGLLLANYVGEGILAQAVKVVRGD